MKKDNTGDILVIIALLLFTAVLWVLALKSPSEDQETISVTFEPIETTQLNIEAPEVGEVFERTHEVKVNEFSYEDAQLLMGIAQAEAGNQGTDGMWLVMSVVLNRVHSDEWPSTIREVIYQPYQFYSAGIGKTDISPECHEALARIEQGEVAAEIIGFEKKSNKTLDKYFSCAFDYRDHQFYTLKNE